MARLDLAELSLREVNGALQALENGFNDRDWQIANPQGAHAVAVGLTAPIRLTIEGHVGFYCAGMNRNAEITVDGHAGPGLAENMMSGAVRVAGNASQMAGATGHGVALGFGPGLIVEAFSFRLERGS